MRDKAASRLLFAHSEIQKSGTPRFKLLLFAVFVMAARAVIFRCNLDYENFSSVHNAVIALIAQIPIQVDTFAGKYYRWLIWNLSSDKFFAAKQDFLIAPEMISRNGTEILNFDPVFHSCCCLARLFGDDGFPQGILAEKKRTNSVDTYIGPVSCNVSVMGNLQLPSRDKCIGEDKAGRYFGPKKLFPLGGCILSACGLMLLFEVLDYVYLNRGFNVNMAVGVFFLGGIMISGGCLLIFMFVFP